MLGRVVKLAREWSALLLVSGVMASPLAAQDPAPPRPAQPDTIPSDTLPADTIAEEPDTARFVVPPDQLPEDTVPEIVPSDSVPPDSLIPAPVLPAFPDPSPEELGLAIWEWDQEELQRFHGRSLFDLLREIPFLTITRAGVYGRPAGISAFGTGGGRARIFLDGYELDPLSAAVLDLQRVALVDLDEVRVVRGLAETRVELTTYRLEDRRPLSYVEAATGNDDTRLLRGYFSRPVGGSNVLTLALDIVDTRGLPNNEPFSTTTGILKWTHAFSPDAGVQLEYRQAGVNRSGEGSPVEASYGHMILRARAQAAPGLWLDGMVGRSSRSPEAGDSLGLDVVSNQAALRAAFVRGAGWLTGTARMRFGDSRGFAEPSTDLSMRAGVQPLPGVALSGEVHHAKMDSVSGTEVTGKIRFGPFGGFSIFGSATGGARGVAILRDSTYRVITTSEPQYRVNGEIVAEADTAVIRDFYFPMFRSKLDGLRAGVEWSGLGATVGAAVVSSNSDITVPLGLPFDVGLDPLGRTELTGIEAYLSTPVLAPPLRLDVSYSRALDSIARPYLPDEWWRAALTFHNLYYTGNLEPTIRVEALHQGRTLTPAIDTLAFSAETEPYTLLNVFLQIRVLDVQAFLRWENVLNLEGVDIPGHPFSTQRALYGVRWSFYN